MGGKWKRKAEGRKKKKTCRNCLEGELKCNFHIISHGQSSHLITPSFLHITYKLYYALFHLSVACGLQTYFGLSLLSLRKFPRERSDDWKYVCSSQANLSANMKITDIYRLIQRRKRYGKGFY